MSDNTTADPGAGGDTFRLKDRAGIKTQIVALDLAPGGSETLMNGTMPVSGTVTASGPLTDTQLRATAVPVSGTVTASGPLTDTQLRATAVPVSGTVTATGPVTDTQLRASAVPVSLATLPTLAAGTNLVGQVTPTPGTAGGWSPKLFTALTNTKVLINGAACTLGGHLTIYNPNAAVAYIQVFDAATTGAVTLGTTTPTALIIIPAASAANVEVSLGVHMASGIVIAATTTATNATALGSTLDGTLLFK